jgi:hypothetical protein
MTGDYFAYFTAQRSGWNKQMMFPLLALFRDGEATQQFLSFYALAFMLILIWSFRKIPLSLQVMAWLMILLPLSGGRVDAITRYIACAFPFMLIFGKILACVRYRGILIAVLLCLHAWTFWYWVTADPFSY